MKTFKDYYANDEFREKHMNYLKHKIQCECGKEVSRVNINRHKLTIVHLKRMEDIKKKEYNLSDVVLKMKKDIDSLKNQINNNKDIK